MDVIAATFEDGTAARSAAHDLETQLHLDDGFVQVDPVRDVPRGSVGRHPATGDAILIAWVRADERGTARDVIGRHRGRHLPLDWLVALQEEIDPATIPAV
jgi:hypothetical protein